MAITHIGSGDSTRNGNWVAPVIHASATTDDFMVAFVTYSVNGATETWDDDGGGGNGWTQLFSNNETAGRDFTAGCFYKVHDGSESDPTCTLTGASSGPISGVIEVYRGVDTSTPFDVVYAKGDHWDAGVDDALPTNQPIDTASNGAFVVLAHYATNNDISAGAAPTNYTIRSALTPGSSYNNKQIFTADREIASAGTETPGAWLHTASPDNAAEWGAITLALKAAGGAATNPKGPLGHPFHGPFGGPI